MDVALAVMRGTFGAYRGRTLVATLAIALGVALGFAIQTVNRSAIAEFTQGVAALSGSAEAQNYVGEIYMKGLGTPPDYGMAAHREAERA